MLAVWFLYSWTSDDHWQEWGSRPLVAKAATFGVILAAWTNLEWLAARLDGSRLLLPLIAVAGATVGILFAAAQIIPFGFLTVPLVATLAIAWIVSWFAPGISLAKGGVPIVVLTIAALATTGYLTSDPGRFPRPRPFCWPGRR